MIEDTIYRTSSQFRFWSFTEDSLRSIRTRTNAYASDRVRVAIHRARQSDASSSTSAASPAAVAGTPGASSTSTPDPGDRNGDNDSKISDAERGKDKDKDVQCLTPEEEQELVRYYCEKTLQLGDVYVPPLPTIVRATAIQYLRRFYLTNSPMTYHPKTIMSCALFLATKTENYYMSLRQFAHKIPSDTTPEDVIAPEFLLMQSLRFTFDVRHPFRGLEGGVMELSAIAQGMGQPTPHFPNQTAEDLRRELLSVHNNHHKQGGSSSTSSLSTITDRIARAHHKAREILKSAAQMTDVYFLFTPAQIWWSAFFLADRKLAEFYLETKLPRKEKQRQQHEEKSENNQTQNGNPAPTPKTNPNPNASGGEGEDNNDGDRNPLSTLRTKLLRTLSNCQNVLQSYKPLSSDPEQMKNLKRIAKKLYHCQNPEKTSTGSGANIAAGKKREGARIPAAAAVSSGSGSSSGAGANASGTVVPSVSTSEPAVTEESGTDGPEVGTGTETDTEHGERVAKRRKVEVETSSGDAEDQRAERKE